MAQVIGVPKETFPGEKRVATVPEVVGKLAKLGFGVIVQSGAGEAASIGDEAYVAAGARVVPDAAAIWSGADIIFKVRAPGRDEVQSMREGQILVSFIWP
ncbi:MAG TPA: NAD(P)(+) transhydrogenase (Re/Si-specific) subunit alpha, partial [Usitatibacter sp.]